MQTTEEFVSKLGIKIKNSRPSHNTHMPDWKDADHWLCVLTRIDGEEEFSLTTPVSKGSGHKGVAPNAAEVLSCLASDASSYENADDPSEFAHEFGYTDKNEATRVYHACGESRRNLYRFLTSEHYEELLYEVHYEELLYEVEPY